MPTPGDRVIADFSKPETCSVVASDAGPAAEPRVQGAEDAGDRGAKHIEHGAPSEIRATSVLVRLVDTTLGALAHPPQARGQRAARSL
jgi:hypothetical protein